MLFSKMGDTTVNLVFWNSELNFKYRDKCVHSSWNDLHLIMSTCGTLLLAFAYKKYSVCWEGGLIAAGDWLVGEVVRVREDS